MRPFLVPPKLKTVKDRVRYWAAAQGVGLTDLGLAILGPSNTCRQNARRIFYRKVFWPRYIDRACKILRIPEEERLLMHRLGAREQGWDVPE